MTYKTVTFLCKQLVLIGIQLIKEYKSMVNGFLKTISDKTLYKLHLTKIPPKRFFDHYPIHLNKL